MIPLTARPIPLPGESPATPRHAGPRQQGFVRRPVVDNRDGAFKPAMLEGESDEQFMALVAAGEQAAFRALMARHMRRAIRVAQGIVGRAPEADDVAQDVFLRVWQRARSFDPALGRFTTWMHRIAVNLAIDRRRHPPTEPLELAETVVDTSPGALATLIQAEERAAMANALARLPQRQRAAVTFFHFEGLSGRKCAQAMNMSESAFESLLTRARAALKQNVETALQNRGRRP